MSMDICAHVYMCKSVYVYMCVYMYMCIRIYVYMYIRVEPCISMHGVARVVATRVAARCIEKAFEWESVRPAPRKAYT